MSWGSVELGRRVARRGRASGCGVWLALLAGGAVLSAMPAASGQGVIITPPVLLNMDIYGDVVLPSDVGVVATQHLRFWESSSAGNVQITNTGGEVGFSDFATAATARFVLDGDGEILFHGNSSAGTATFTVQDGTVAFNGDASGGMARFVLDGGTLDIRNVFATNFALGSIAGSSASADVSIGAGRGLTLGGDNLSTRYDGRFLGGASESSRITKVGAGTFIHNGNMANIEQFAVSSGGVLVNGVSGADFIVNSGALLGGAGRIGSLDLAGTLDPGATAGAIGTFTVDGDAIFQSGSRYRVDLSPSSADQLQVGGQLTILGSEVVVAALDPSANYMQAQTSRIISAADLVGAENLVLSLNSSLLAGKLIQSGDAIDLRIQQTASFDTLGTSKMEKESGKGLSALEPTKDSLRLATELLSMSDQAVAKAMKDLVTTPPALAAARTPPPPPVLSKPTSKSGSGSTTPTRADLLRVGGAQAFFASTGSPGVLAIEDAELAAAANSVWSIWLAPVAAYGAASMPNETVWMSGGLQGGVEAHASSAISDISVGLLFGAQRTGIVTADPDSFTDRQAATLGVYAGWSTGGTSLSADLGQTLELVDSRRYLSIGAIDYTASASYLQHMTSFSAELAHAVEFGEAGVALTPAVSLDGGWLYHDGYTETGAGPIGLVVDPLSALRLDGAVGATLSRTDRLEGGALTTSASLRYQRELIDGTRRQTMRFAESSASMDIEQPAGDPDRALVGLGVAYADDSGLEGSLSYSGSFSRSSYAHGVSASIGSSF